MMSVRQFSQIAFVRAFSYLLIIAQLGACGGGGGSNSAESSLDSPSPSLSIVPASSTTLNWTAPVARSDQSPLSLADIGGYRVYYGTVEGEYPYRIDVNDGTAVEVVINDLPTGIYYFVVTTYDTEGRESEYSKLVVKAI
jgi:hypothetical protein